MKDILSVNEKIGTFAPLRGVTKRVTIQQEPLRFKRFYQFGEKANHNSRLGRSIEEHTNERSVLELISGETRAAARMRSGATPSGEQSGDPGGTQDLGSGGKCPAGSFGRNS